MFFPMLFTVVTSGAGGIGTVESGVDAQGFVTGKWDCMTVSTLTPPKEVRPNSKR